MFYQCILFYILIVRLVNCDRSFTLVIDTTRSMQLDLDVIKANIPSVLNTLGKTDIGNYIIVPFNDDVGQPIFKTTALDLISALNGLTADGGIKLLCPENSLTGIEMALQISKDRSDIFVFTDAYSKDANKKTSIENLCRSTGSKVVIVLSGFCSSPDVDVQVYYDVAKACSGAVLRFNESTLRQAFAYIKQVINVQWTDIATSETFNAYRQLSFSVDAFTKTALVVAAGESPTVEIQSQEGFSTSIDKIVDSRNTQVIQLKEAKPGHYTIIVRCKGTTSLTLYKRYELPIHFGFSTRMPRSMKETSQRPMPGKKNYILIDNSHSNMKLEKLEIQFSNELEKKQLDVRETVPDGFYWTEILVDVDTTFRILITGSDTSTYQEIKGSTEIFVPQQAVGVIGSRMTLPRCEILERDPITVDFGTNATVACKVSGYPTPSISWEDDNSTSLSSENVLLEIPALYISYVNIENARTNTTIYCKPMSKEGADSCSLRVNVFRPYTFEVVQTPTDQSIEYGSEGKLYCEVSAYPEAAIQWYHNDTTVTDSDQIQVINEENALWIKNMSINTIGDYKCEVTNEANMKTYNAFVSISGIEPPEVKVENNNIVLKPGDWSYLECSIINGKPLPTITWAYKSEGSFDFGSLPDGVVADDGRLKIASAQSDHKGVYRCTAGNIAGETTADINIQLKYPPTILNLISDNKPLIVKEEDEVELFCNVTGSPEPRVHWEMTRGVNSIQLDERHHTDSQYTHRFKALSRDSGNYHCIAENDIGSTKARITVDVQVAPYIEPPKSKLMVLRTGETVVLSCNVKYGNPVPTTKWTFIATDSTSKVLSRHNAARPLHLTNVNYTNEGTYLCIADNDVGTDSIQIYVKIQ